MKFLLTLLPAVLAAYTCLDESGKPVDWFIALKHPNGGVYSYIDANSPTAFKRSLYDLTASKGGAVINTVKQLYYTKSTDGVAIYNDQDDTGHSLASHAHSKGFAAFNTDGGFWMVHSLPKWPKRRATGYDGLSDDTYGQTFMCMTLDFATFNDVGQLWGTNWAQFYDTNSPAAFAKKLPDFDNAVAGKKSGTIQLNLQFKTAGGQAINAFAKDKTTDENLYAEFVAPTLKSNLAAETWQNGKGSMPSNCTAKYTVKNVATIETAEGDQWRINQDHSKWCVTQDSTVYAACVGDINRQTSQTGRGGGTYCLPSKSVWGAFNHIIQTVQDCPGENSLKNSRHNATEFA